ncbi:Uncharacterised protein [Mycobacteroides abscessus subsp. abscessus]|nr:Uncharacterised protein [Mycobacteroides abscessus subsp. abscessus]
MLLQGINEIRLIFRDAILQDDKCFDDCSADFVRAGHDGTFLDVRMFDKSILHLKRPDCISGADDNIISPAFKPEIPVFILFRFVSGHIIFTPELHGGPFRILIIIFK